MYTKLHIALKETGDSIRWLLPLCRTKLFDYDYAVGWGDRVYYWPENLIIRRIYVIIITKKTVRCEECLKIC